MFFFSLPDVAFADKKGVTKVHAVFFLVMFSVYFTDAVFAIQFSGCACCLFYDFPAAAFAKNEKDES